MKRWPQSLQGRLLAMVLGAVALVWLGAAAWTTWDARHELDELLDGHLAQAAALLVVQQARSGDDDDHGVDAPSLHRYAPQVAFQVWHEGRLTMRSSNAPREPMTKPGDHFKEGFRTLSIDGTRWRVFAALGREHDVQVYVGEQLSSRQSILVAVLRSLVVSLLVALPLLALAGWLAVRSGTAPLRRLVLNDVGPTVQWEALERIGQYLGKSVDVPSLEEGARALLLISKGFGPHTADQWLALSAPMFKPREGGGLRLHYDPRIAVPACGRSYQGGVATAHHGACVRSARLASS